MPAILALLGRMLAWLVANKLGQWILKALVALGIGVVVHKFAAPAFMSFIQSHASGLSAFLFQCFGALGGDVVMSMIISATIASVAGNMTLKAMTK